MIRKNILLVEDDVSLRFAVESFLAQQNDFEVRSVGSIQNALSELEKNHYDIVLSDVKMPQGSGFDILQHIKEKKKNTLVIFMSAYGSVEQAVHAVKEGAYEFIVKPFPLVTIENVIRSALQEKELFTRAAEVVDVSHDKGPEQNLMKERPVFITNHPKTRELLDNLKKIAASKATVLVQGESGTGKEVLARMIHEFSSRRDRLFVAINCAALPDNLLESELFGHEKGSFTGAVQRQIGKFEIADGGTILLDEISEMSLNMQTKLLRVLQECEIYRVGGNKPIPLNLRVIASTNRDLFKFMKEGHFREDLFYRINVIPIYVPPLRDRSDDVIVLARYYLSEFAKIHERDVLELDEATRYKILHYPWFGNVRELKNAMERATLVGSFDEIIKEQELRDPSPLDAILNEGRNLSAQGTVEPIDLTLGEVEKRVIYETLRRYDGNRTKTAEKLGISLRTLRNKLKQFEIEDGGEEVGAEVES